MNESDETVLAIPKNRVDEASPSRLDVLFGYFKKPVRCFNYRFTHKNCQSYLRHSDGVTGDFIDFLMIIMYNYSYTIQNSECSNE